MPQLPDPSGILTRPASVALRELAIAAGVVGESVTITSGFAANTLCQIWKYDTQTRGTGNVIHVRSKRDLKGFAQRIASVRAVFVYAPRFYQDVAWQTQKAGSETMSPRPAVFCGFQHDDPDLDPGITLPLTNDERETAAVHNWVAAQTERRGSFAERCARGSESPGLKSNCRKRCSMAVCWYENDALRGTLWLVHSPRRV